MKEKIRRQKGKIESDRTIPQRKSDCTEKSKVVLLEEYYNYDSMRLLPATIGTLERLIENGIKWARENDDALKLAQWLDKNGVSNTTWRRWEERHPFFKEGTQQIVRIIGIRRELGLLRFKLQPQAVLAMMAHYDEDWKRIFEWRASLNKKEGTSTGGPQIVVLEKTPDSPLVPPRKEEE